MRGRKEWRHDGTEGGADGRERTQCSEFGAVCQGLIWQFAGMGKGNGSGCFIASVFAIEDSRYLEHL